MLVTDENMRRESRAWFRRQADHGVTDAQRLADHLRITADELSRDGYLDDATESVQLLTQAAACAVEAKRLAALAEAQLPAVVR